MAFFKTVLQSCFPREGRRDARGFTSATSLLRNFVVYFRPGLVGWGFSSAIQSVLLYHQRGQQNTVSYNNALQLAFNKYCQVTVNTATEAVA